MQDYWCPVCGSAVPMVDGAADDHVYTCGHPSGPHQVQFNVYGVMQRYVAPEATEAPAAKQEDEAAPPQKPRTAAPREGKVDA